MGFIVEQVPKKAVAIRRATLAKRDEVFRGKLQGCVEVKGRNVVNLDSFCSAARLAVWLGFQVLGPNGGPTV